MLRTCFSCREDRPLVDFSVGHTRGGRKYRFRKCKLCRAKHYAKIYSANPKKERERAYSYRTKRLTKHWHLSFQYGITLDFWKKLFKKQGRKCAICKRKTPIGRGWCTDHKGEKVRGILCTSCNTFIGMARESEKILKSAIAYLRKHK